MENERVSTRCIHEVAELHDCSWDQVMSGVDGPSCDCCSDCEWDCTMEV